MRCLWLTRKHPRPANSGELIYSLGTISSFARAGAEVVAIAHDNEEAPVAPGNGEYVDEDGVRWRLGQAGLGGRVMSLFTSLPSDSYRLRNGGLSEIFESAIREETWDAVVIDHAAMGWALRPLRERFGAVPEAERPRLVYLSHNHEAKIRREIARQSFEFPPRRLAAQWDAEKYGRQEDDLCRECDLVSAITETEVEAYRESFPEQQYLSLSPGYDGPRHPGREITADTPRRVLMTGSFEWVAKRSNLEFFLKVSSRMLEEAKVELQVVGKTDEYFREAISRQYPSVNFVGRVPSVEPYLLDARMGLIVETLGGGFKLKALDYIFHGLPLAGLRHAVEGLPLESPSEVLLLSSLPTLMREVIGAIDDIARLNRMSRACFEKCADAFHWEDRGRDLLAAIEAI